MPSSNAGAPPSKSAKRPDEADGAAAADHGRLRARSRSSAPSGPRRTPGPAGSVIHHFTLPAGLTVTCTPHGGSAVKNAFSCCEHFVRVLIWHDAAADNRRRFRQHLIGGSFDRTRLLRDDRHRRLAPGLFVGVNAFLRGELHRRQDAEFVPPFRFVAGQSGHRLRSSAFIGRTRS